MVERNLVICNELGLHARAAAKFVKCASGYQAEICICKGTLEVNGKSIMGVLLLAAPKGSSVVIRSDGPDEDAALAALEALISDGFGEG